MSGPVNSYSIRWSLIVHGILLLAAVLGPMLPGFRRPKDLQAPQEFTVVLDPNLVPPDADSKPEEVAAPQPEPDDFEPPQPIPDPPKDAVVVTKKEPDKKPPEKKPPEKKEPPKKKEFVKGKRVQRKVDTPSPAPVAAREDFSKKYKRVTDAMLTRAEIEKALREGARVGTRNSIPPDEMSRCVALVKRALYDEWDQPSLSDAGTRPVLMDIRIDSAGRIVSYRIRQSAGSAFFDQSVLKAAANCPPIRGLTQAFIKQYETLTIEFKLQ